MMFFMRVLFWVGRFRSYIVFSMVAMAIMGYFAYHSMVGERGFHSWKSTNHELSKARQELSMLEREKKQLERQTLRLRPESLDPDLLEEKAKAILNFVHPDEVIVFESNGDQRGAKKP